MLILRVHGRWLFPFSRLTFISSRNYMCLTMSGLGSSLSYFQGRPFGFCIRNMAHELSNDPHAVAYLNPGPASRSWWRNFLKLFDQPIFYLLVNNSLCNYALWLPVQGLVKIFAHWLYIVDSFLEGRLIDWRTIDHLAILILRPSSINETHWYVILSKNYWSNILSI